ncbi:Sec-independent protein translocase subunit TatB [Pseudomonas sp. v388]|uniref:Sec-independent protein translocase protein TatB n=1 Tax=Pseudomonas sp. v388 TaxID=2479849 RepID=UPI000F79C8C8|nr:Sec-independent protein translocase protein TatB [Pseudomonas sp. v388]RRV09346.1 Sec-independent protein translocase subunit TatB [Pseudomonas sp. v388]
MFGVSFQELLLVGLVALLVLGPERLPSAARTAGLWIGRLKRSFNAIKQEVEREIGADEIRRQLHNEHILGLEEEARKLFNQNAPSQPPAEQPADVEPQPAHTADTGPAQPPVPTHLSLDKPARPPVSPAPAAPPVHDSTLPPRAP